MPRAVKFAALAAAWSGALFLLAPFLYAFGFCFPRGDDFDEITRAMFLFDLPGGIYEIGREWLSWSGRFTYHFLAVFLGKAAENRFICGLVCCVVLCLYAVGAFRLARLPAVGALPRNAALFGLFALLVFCVNCPYPEIFYILTDSLTICLQGAMFLLFFGSVCLLWQRAGSARENSGQVAPLILGILAIGLYEHAAMAVFWTSLSAWILAVWQAGNLGAQESAMHGEALGKVRAKRFRRLFIWLCCALVFSFMAPGNFQRRMVRKVQPEIQWMQLREIWPDFCDALISFFTGPYLPASICLAILLAVFTFRRKNSDQINWYLAAICCIACICFDLCLITLHALSDMPFSISPKFAGSLQFYTAIAAVAAIYAPACAVIRRMGKSEIHFAALAVLVLLVLSAQTANFRMTAATAANGDLFLAGQFMERRIGYLRSLEVKNGISHPPFGLIGEIQDANARKRAIVQDLPQAVVESMAFQVFPVFIMHELASVPDGWPNLWAAWVYGLGSISAVPPNPETALTALREGKAVELAVPAGLADAGIMRSWRVRTAGQNPTFASDWLIFELGENAPERVSILRPNPLARERLLPLSIQKWLLENTLEQSQICNSFWRSLAVSCLDPVFHEAGTTGLHVLYAGMALPAGMEWPAPVFASADGLMYHRLQPWIH